MSHIPQSLPNDAEDVAWALSTAESLWKRGDHADALVWVRRGAEAASDAEDDDRALALARAAADLKEWLEARARYTTEMMEDDAEPEAASPNGAAAVSSVTASMQAQAVSVAPDDVEEILELDPDASIPPAPATLASVLPEAPRVSLAPDATAPLPRFALEDSIHPVTIADAPVPSAVQEAMTADAPRAIPFPPSSEHSAITRVAPPAPETVPQYKSQNAPPPPSSSQMVVATAPPSSVRVPSAAPSQPAVKPSPSARPPRPLPSARAPVSLPPLVRLPTAGMKPPAARVPLPPPPEPKRDVQNPEEALAALEVTRPASTPPPAPEAPEPSSERSSEVTAVAPVPAAPAASGAIDFAQCADLAGLSEEARTALAASVSITSLARGEEQTAGALSLVLAGEVTVSASVVDAAALTVRTGELLCAQGTIDAHLGVRIIAASDTASVASWTEEAMIAALVSSPSIEQGLRRKGNRTQAMCGATIGPLGERLDASLLDNVTTRLDAIPYVTNGVVVEAGAHPGIILVGAGEVKADDGTVFTSGDFVFPELVLGGGKATQNVRAVEGGAIVLMGDRSVVQELLATSPTLIEILAGM